MRPIKVTMTAFGPYKNQEIVDFNELNNHKLFVISGSTGAGKTTIFDAICFALYGNASGEDRNDIRMLRSDFAEDDVFTSVNFEFELKGRTYRILRQLAHVKQGNKTATGDKYELYEIKGGQEVPLTDRFIVSQVDGKIQEIIGLTKEQFSQIVMLPQGEFRKLLTSETENKEEVLRKIFKTSFYKTVAEHLNTQKRETQKRFDEHVKERDIYIQHIKASLPKREESELNHVFSQDYYNTNQVIKGLEKEILYYTEGKQIKHTALQEKSKQLQELNNRYLYAQRLNERFDLLELKRKAKHDLEQRKVEIQEKEQSFMLGEKASHLEVLEKHDREMEDEVGQKRKYVEDTKVLEIKAKQVLLESERNFQQEKRNSGLREKITLELDRLGEFLPTVSKLDKKKQELMKMSTEVESLTKQVDRLDTLVKQKQTEKTLLISQIKPLDENVRLLPDKTERIGIMREKVTVLKEYLKLATSYRENFQIAETAKARFEKIEIEYDQLETRWVEGQASLLATHLHDGKPCPVCGSVEHPRKGELTQEIPTKEELEEKRKIKREVEQAFSLAKAELSSTIQQLAEKKKEVIEHGFVPEEARVKYDEIAKAGKELAHEVAQLKKDQQLVDKLRKTNELFEAEIDSASSKLKGLVNQLHEIRLQFQTEKSLYEQSIANIPEDLQSLELLEVRTKETKLKKEQADLKWQQAQVEYQTSSEKLATASANYQNAIKQLSDSIMKKEQTEGAFLDAMTKAGFENKEMYANSKMSATALEALKTEIDEFNTALKTVIIQLQDMEHELSNQERTDLSALKEELEQSEQQVEEIRTEYQQLQNYYEKAQEGIANILAADEGLQGVEQQLQLIRDLFDVVRGENTKKISFERYLQIEFLEQIIIAANERLKHLSNGQYELVRSDRLEKRGRQSGLGLDVLDNYTGLYRDVKTLSGGEKFNASLCLALGMADVIQSYEGGISIETMFIDEGFGSLDEESLNKAIDTLIDLQKSGRMIGVISHVQELKQAIPAILEVEKTKEGYSQTRFVVS